LALLQGDRLLEVEQAHELDFRSEVVGRARRRLGELEPERRVKAVEVRNIEGLTGKSQAVAIAAFAQK
jgi:hypothetical protein